MFSRPQKKLVALIVLDGWGVAPSWGGNAISQARTKVFDSARQKYPNTLVQASGPAVGLPVNSPGNSEAGHLNIGAGYVVHQDITLIDAQIDNENFYHNEKILKAITHAKENNSALHLMGLLSKTGTHSHIRHLFALLKLIKENSFSRVYIHLFSDGRDSDPYSGVEMVNEVENKLSEIGVGKIASVSGRFYAMDRDNRWGRISRTYNLLTKGEGNCFESARTSFSASYAQGITDEFIEPRLIVNKMQEKILIKDNDSIIFFNFRSDRVRELTQAFLDKDLKELPDRVILKNLYMATFVVYDDSLLAEQVFSPEKIESPLAKVWADNGLRQFHIAETEKYPHVTYFINGGSEKPFPGEDRLMIPSSRKAKTYDYIPRMSADKVTDELIRAVKSNRYDGLVANFANADMVGHTGNLAATIQAVECVDQCLERILPEILSRNGVVFLVGDHGNAEQMVNPATGEPDTEHTTNPVPFYMISDDANIMGLKMQNNGILGSVSPTILDIMSLKKPELMRNNSLIIKEFTANDTKTNTAAPTNS